jgi:hypothetical protein
MGFIIEAAPAVLLSFVVFQTLIDRPSWQPGLNPINVNGSRRSSTTSRPKPKGRAGAPWASLDLGLVERSNRRASLAFDCSFGHPESDSWLQGWPESPSGRSRRCLSLLWECMARVQRFGRFPRCS